METPVRQINHRPIVDFTTFVNDTKAKYKGRNGRREPAFYIPHGPLYEYWTPATIRAVLQSFEFIYPINHIRESYLRVFSTLVYINMVEFLDILIIHNVLDGFFPRRFLPPALEGPIYKPLLNAIIKEQWIFFPLVLDKKLLGTHLDSDCILPFDTEEQLVERGTAQLSKVHIHHSCIKLSGSVSKGSRLVPQQPRLSEISHSGCFVVKTYKDSKYSLYRNEVKILTQLHEHEYSNVVGYYGCFEQDHTYNIILQYADGGNLWDFLKDEDPPKTWEELWRFWKSFSSILDGLHAIHQCAMGKLEKSAYRA
jgi:hypothetical protein